MKKHLLLALLLWGITAQLWAEDTTIEDTTYDYAWFDSSLNENFTVMLNTCNEQKGLKDLTEDHCNWKANSTTAASNEAFTEGGTLHILHERMSAEDNWTDVSLQFVDWIGGTGVKFGGGGDTVGGMYVNMENEVIVYATIESTVEIDLRLDLMDVNGHIGNSGTVRNTIPAGAAHDFEFDFDEELWDWYAGDFWGVSNGRYSPSELTVGEYTKTYGAREFIPFDASKVAKMMWSINDAKQGTIGEEIYVQISDIIVGDEDYAVSYRNFDDEYYNCFDGSNIIQAIYPNPKTGEYLKGVSCEDPITAQLGMNSASVTPEQNQWFAFTPSESGSYTVSNCGKTSFDTELRIIANCIGEPVAYSDDYCEYQSEVTFDATAGATYYISWGNLSYYNADFDWSITKEDVQLEVLHITEEMHTMYRYEGFSTDYLYLDAFFQSSLPITYSASVLNSSSIVQVGVEGSYLYIESVIGTGIATILVTANDGENELSQQFDIVVSDPNAPGQDCDNPVVATIGDNRYNATVPTNFYSFIPTESGRYTVSSCNNTDINTLVGVLKDCDSEIVYAVNDDYCDIQSQLTFDAEQYVEYLIVWDADETGTVSFDWTIEKVGDISTTLALVKPLEDVYIEEGVSEYYLSFSDYFSSSNSIEYSLEYPSDANITIIQELGLNYVEIFGSGTTPITVTAKSGGKELTHTFDIVVAGGEPCTDCGSDLITVIGFEDLELTSGFSQFEIDLSEGFVHNNGSELTYTASSYNGTDVIWSQDSSMLKFIIGTTTKAEFIVYAYDSEDNEAMARFTVTILDNQAPRVIDVIEDIVIEEGTEEPIVIDLETIFDDNEYDKLSYSVYTSTLGSVQSASVIIEENDLIITELTTGNTIVRLSAFDGDKFQELTFSVTVNEVGNIAPMPVEPVVVEEVYVGSSEGIALVHYFTDDQADLTYSVLEDRDDVYIFNDSLYFAQLSSGAHQITIVADDDNGGLTSIDLNMIVQEESVTTPVMKRPLEYQVTLSPNKTEEHIQLSRIFTDIEGGELTYLVSSNNENICDVDEEVGMLIITGKSYGQTTVDLMVVTESGGYITKQFQVTYSEEDIIPSNVEEYEAPVKVYPTLVDDVLTVEATKGKQLQIFTMQSLLVYETKVDASVITVDVKTLQSGMYFVLIDGKQTRFIKQ